MSSQTFTPGADGEVLRPAFPDIDESERPYTLVSYGLSFDKACRKHADGFLGVDRVYIIASKGLAAHSDALQRLESALGEKHVGTWMGIPVHSPYDGILPVIHDVKAKNADCLITLGGGSLADAAKLITYALENGVNEVEDLVKLEGPFIKMTEAAFRGIGNAPKIKTVFIPSTLSAAEFSKFAGCTNPQNRLKVQFTHPGMFASLIILSEDVCKTTPGWVWVSTGVRAIDHCVENICSKRPRPEADHACDRGLRRLVKALLAYVRNPNDADARLEAQLGSNDAMTGLTLLVMCGASHGIGHMLGPLGIGHGQTSCILLPNVMKYNATANPSQQEHIKSILWSEPEIAKVLRRTLDQSNSDAGDALRAIFNEFGMPASLKEVGIGRDKWDQLAKNSLDDNFVKVNPRPITTPDQVKEILEMCSGDN